MRNKKCKHKFELDGGPCIKCRKTWVEAMDEDVPICHSPSISSIEKAQNRGFWGNAKTGYVFDKDNQ